jgi:hypothetical protein
MLTNNSQRAPGTEEGGEMERGRGVGDMRVGGEVEGWGVRGRALWGWVGGRNLQGREGFVNTRVSPPGPASPHKHLQPAGGQGVPLPPSLGRWRSGQARRRSGLRPGRFAPREPAPRAAWAGRRGRRERRGRHGAVREVKADTPRGGGHRGGGTRQRARDHQQPRVWQ